ncbi:error-prone DNA polymerase [Pseudovibrio exalbescens]|uniref:error-prone DNA polymerase n=1 Tax=Pseudovibrio exalbescens TaxID=197461 RepID=UPI0023667D1C|nr:error-prone DNA polymerase [Pseudovibrio exalbescens]MDD7909370.1 error-prone DNA polymerase [Pseudovibrio exalbescens]
MSGHLLRQSFVELGCATNFSFLHGASHPEELAFTAGELGMPALGVTDRNTLAGVVRVHTAAKEAGIRTLVGCRLVFLDGTPDILVWPTDIEAYQRLSRLLTIGNRRAPKGECHLHLEDLMGWGEGLIMAPVPLALPRQADEAALCRVLGRLTDAFGARVRLAARFLYYGSDRRWLGRLQEIGAQQEVALLATNDVLYHRPERRPLQDVISCIRLHKTLETAGRLLEANAERHLKPYGPMLDLFQDCPSAVSESLRVADEITFSLDELAYTYPDETFASGLPPQEELSRLAEEGMQRRYPGGVPDKVRATVARELELVEALQYAPYFLTVYDIVRFARSRGILCQGRGSAANSSICFCLGITEVDPDRADLLFERFISPERKEPPDIDVDFEHERREEVIQYIYEKYGREQAGLAATVICYRSRSALREVAKVFGFSEDAMNALSGTIWGRSDRGGTPGQIRDAGLDPEQVVMTQVLKLAHELIGFPRHLSQHVGGFVITRGRLDDMVPIQNAAMADRTVIEWDKDDLDALGILKIDILALGMLSAIRRALVMLKEDYGVTHSIASIPAEESQVYDMISRADTLGVFQIESRAQMSMLPRMKPRTFYDLVIEVAIVRPGPIQGDMVHPYLRRRQGLEQVNFPKEELREVLGKTLGVPLFQEQAMKIAIVAAGFEPAEADRLRRAMATFRRVGTIGTFQRKMVEGMVARGYEADFAERCFKQIEGFGEYGFPESHAASFALLVYASAWIKARYPDVFCAALLNSQPMGFYAPAQLVRDAREHGVEVREVDVNMSEWETILEPGSPARNKLHYRHREMAETVYSDRAVRLGFRMIKGVRQEDMARLVARRGRGYDSVRDLWLRTGLPRAVIARLAEADAFRSLGLDRRTALWAAQGLEQGGAAERLPLFDRADLDNLRPEPDVNLPPMHLGEHVVLDYQSLSLSLKAHPVSFVRPALQRMRVTRAADLVNLPSGRRVTVSGLVLVRQRPGSAKGVIFMTLEDETAVANVIIWPKCFEKYRPIVLGARFVKVSGHLQNAEGVIHVVAEKLEDASGLLSHLSAQGLEDAALAHADEVKRPVQELAPKIRPKRGLAQLIQEVPEVAQDYENLSRTAQRVMPKGRNFH